MVTETLFEIEKSDHRAKKTALINALFQKTQERALEMKPTSADFQTLKGTFNKKDTETDKLPGEPKVVFCTESTMEMLKLWKQQLHWAVSGKLCGKSRMNSSTAWLQP